MAKLWRGTLIFSFLTTLSRVFGLIRDVVMTAVFGAGPLMDAFLVAFKIPNFFRRLFAEGAFSQAFVPVLSEYKTQKDHDQVRKLIRATSGSLLVILTVMTVLVMIGAPWVVRLFAPGFVNSPEQFQITTDLLRITFPYLLLISLTAFAGGVLNAYDSFAAPALAPVFLNLSLIVAALVVAPKLSIPIMALGWAVFVAGILQLLLQMPELWQKKLLTVPVPDFKHEGVRRILTLMLPALFGVSVTQINLLLNTIFASLMISGSVTWLYAAERLSELPMGLIAIAIGTVILPSLSRKFSSQDTQGYTRLLDWATQVVVIFGLPASVGLFMLSGPLIDMLFVRGAFTGSDAAMSTLALQALSFGVLAFMLIKVFAPGFFAMQDTKSPVRAGIYAVVSNMLLNLVFISLFHWLSYPLHVALALSSTLAAFVNATTLYLMLKQKGIFQFEAHWISLGIKLLVANALMALLLYVLNAYYPAEQHLMFKLSFVLVSCVVAALVYGASLYILGIRIKHLKAPE